VIGYLSVSQGIGIGDLPMAGPGLTFITYPTAISLLPFAAAMFGIFFFIALLTFGIDSAFSMIEPISASANQKWKISKAKATAIMCTLGFFVSLLFATGGGVHLLEILDHFVTNFGLVSIGLLECIMFGWLLGVYKLRKHANETSDIMLGRWWEILIKYIIPFILIILLIAAVIKNLIDNPYPDFPSWIVILAGIAPLLIITVLSFILMKIKGNKEAEEI
jgi:NSS family neurotransmitter:Na+ symporter